jgi:hypothetical protein
MRLEAHQQVPRQHQARQIPETAAKEKYNPVTVQPVVVV